MLAKKMFSLLGNDVCETKRTVIESSRAGVKRSLAEQKTKKNAARFPGFGTRATDRRPRSSYVLVRYGEYQRVTFEERLNTEVPRRSLIKKCQLLSCVRTKLDPDDLQNCSAVISFVTSAQSSVPKTKL